MHFRLAEANNDFWEFGLGPRRLFLDLVDFLLILFLSERGIITVLAPER